MCVIYIHVCDCNGRVLLGSSCIVKYLKILIDVNNDDNNKVEKCTKCIEKVKKHRKKAENLMKIKKKRTT